MITILVLGGAAGLFVLTLWAIFRAIFYVTDPSSWRPTQRLELPPPEPPRVEPLPPWLLAQPHPEARLDFGARESSADQIRAAPMYSVFPGRGEPTRESLEATTWGVYAVGCDHTPEVDAELGRRGVRVLRDARGDVYEPERVDDEAGICWRDDDAWPLALAAGFTLVKVPGTLRGAHYRVLVVDTPGARKVLL